MLGFTVLLSGDRERVVNRNKTIFFLIAVLLIGSTVAAFKLWPKKYMVRTSMPEAIVFWNGHEAFVFLSLNTTGRAQNVFQEKLTGTKYGYLSLLLGDYLGFYKQNVIAYHLLSKGQLDRFPLPDGTALSGSWNLAEGRLRLTPPAYPREDTSAQHSTGFQWDGQKFVSVAAPMPTPTITTNGKLDADDDASDDENRDYFLNKVARQHFKEAGWHYKLLTAYMNGSAEATLPIAMSGTTFDLTLQSPPVATSSAKFDYTMFGANSIRLSGEKLAERSQVLWTQTGWEPITKNEYEALNQKYGRRYRTPLAWPWLAVFAFLLVWRFGGWLHLLFTFGMMKGRVLKTMPTTFSFPPATPAQFPALDSAALDRYTRELEGMGFTRLLDFSLVSDSASNHPSFCRLLAHTRHHCFGVINQIFPRGKAAFPLRCSFEGCLQNGWTMAFSNRKPQAASSLLRRRKAIGVCMPDLSSSELLQKFLKMREQVCLDLGISPVNDDTMEAYIAKTQRSVGEMREAVKQKSFLKGLPEVYLRKLSLIATKPEYIWLGDYPKEAEQRKQGLSSFATASR